jgi:hypothetical protein
VLGLITIKKIEQPGEDRSISSNQKKSLIFKDAIFKLNQLTFQYPLQIKEFTGENYQKKFA